MKNLFLILLLAGTANAGDNCSETIGSTKVQEEHEITTSVPKHLEGATIIVRLANGKESQVPAEKFKVVPRRQQFVVAATTVSKTISCSSKSSNRFSLLGGYGARNGLTTTKNGNNVTVETSSGLVGGAQYQVMLDDFFSVGVQGQTNGTGSVLIGVDL